MTEQVPIEDPVHVRQDDAAYEAVLSELEAARQGLRVREIVRATRPATVNIVRVLTGLRALA